MLDRLTGVFQKPVDGGLTNRVKALCGRPGSDACHGDHIEVDMRRCKNDFRICR